MRLCGASNLLDEAGAKHIDVFASHPDGSLIEQAKERLQKRIPSKAELNRYHIVLIADLPDEQAFRLATEARRQGALVNVEDRREYCDFFYSSIVRRGDLVLGISTSGQSPTLAVRIRKALEQLFPPIWENRLIELARQRRQWQGQNKSMKEIIKYSDDYIDRKGWFIMGITTSLSRLQTFYGHLDAHDLLRVMIEEEFKDKITLVSSFGTGSALLLSMVAEVNPQLPILFLETGKHFPETLDYVETLKSRLKLTNIQMLYPDETLLNNADPEGNLWYEQPNRCCWLRKVEPLRHALEEGEYQALVTGRKRYQTPQTC